jgi:hypothetical protein
MQLSNTLGDARKLAALCTPWAQNVIVCYDPTANFPPQFQGQWVWVEAVGANILPVAASVPDETTGSWAIYGHVDGEHLAILYMRRPAIDVTEVYAFLETVSGMNAKMTTGSEDNIKPGELLCAVKVSEKADGVMGDAELHWCTQPYNVEQPQA